MHLTDLQLVSAKPPGCIVEGRFALESPHYPGGEPAQAQGAAIFILPRTGYGAWLQLWDVTRDASGLFSRSPEGSRLSIHMPHTVDLEKLLEEITRAIVDPGLGHIERVRLSGVCALGYFTGQIASLEVRTQVLEAGLGVSLAGDTGPLTLSAPFGVTPEPEPTLADSRIRADIVIPWTYLTLLRSPLALLGITPAIRDERPTQRFNFNRPGLAAVALDRSFDIAYFRGTLEITPVARPATGLAARVNLTFHQAEEPRPCVAAEITQTELELTPTITPFVYANGFTVGEYGRGPKLNLFGMGYDAWIKALSGGTTGRLETRGDCVGFLTEMWTGGAVAGRHAVTACTLDLALDAYELVVTLQGEIDRLLTFTGPPLPPKLGKGFSVKMHIPRLFFTLRGVDLLEWGQQQHKLLKGDDGR
jgi:hypothetical protein